MNFVPTNRPTTKAITLAFCLLASSLAAQQSIELDKIAALVNGQPILESDVQQEMRMATFVPGFSNSPNQSSDAAREAARTSAIDRLIDRTLITAQEQWQPPAPVTPTELAADIAELQRRIPDCANSRCVSAAAWAAVLRAHGFTVEEFNTRWRARIEMLRFIELRFRDGARITPDEISAYYNTVLTPQYAAAHATPPPLPTVSKRIQQLLLEQRISSLLEDWLKQLRTEGNVRVLAPGEDLP